jgi:hypothetical protein
MCLTLRSPWATAAIAGGKTRNHSCAQTLAGDDAMDDALKCAPGTFITNQTVKRTQKGFAPFPLVLL